MGFRRKGKITEDFIRGVRIWATMALIMLNAVSFQ